MNFNKIKEYCDQNRMSIADLADKIGISKPGLYRSIQEQTMKVETLEKISKALDVDIWHFFDLDPEAIFIKDIEAQKKSNETNQEIITQMTQVIDDLKRRMRNVQTATIKFIIGRERIVYGIIDKEKYEILIHLFLDFLESNHDDFAFDNFMIKIKSIFETKVPEKDIPGLDH
ncbi:MAG: helix-turn-helix transcriptional regulator [Bacteroidota bacterium]